MGSGRNDLDHLLSYNDYKEITTEEFRKYILYFEDEDYQYLIDLFKKLGIK